MKITFKKGRIRDGLMRLPETYDVRSQGKRIATIQRNRDGSDSFCYGDGFNTAHVRGKSLEECKESLKLHFAQLTSPSGSQS